MIRGGREDYIITWTTNFKYLFFISGVLVKEIVLFTLHSLPDLQNKEKEDIEDQNLKMAEMRYFRCLKANEHLRLSKIRNLSRFSKTGILC